MSGSKKNVNTPGAAQLSE